MARFPAANDPLLDKLRSAYQDVPEQIVHEGAEARMLLQRVKPGMTVFDVGANVGDYAILMSRLVGESGRVLTIEAAGSTFGKLSERLARHGCGNTQAFQYAVYSENTRIEFNEFPEEFSVWNSIGRPQMADPSDPTKQVPLARTEWVEAIRLDDFCRARGVDVIHYMKLDVEGAESEALKGARELLERRAIRFLQFEISRAMLEGMSKQGKEVFDILLGHGYECRRINPDGTLGPEVADSNAFYENYAAFPRGFVHFVTQLTGGAEEELAVRHHARELSALTFDWHWHLVSVAEAAYVDAVARELGGRVTVHRRTTNDGLEAALSSIAEDCILWQIEPEEFWSAEQLVAGRELFLENPTKTAAFYWSWFYVGPGLVTSTRHCYGNDGQTQWLRTWWYRPGVQPWRPVAGVNPFSNEQTEVAGLVVQRAAFVTEGQVRTEAARRGLDVDRVVERWRALQQAESLPVKLRDYLPWVTDETEVDRAEYYVAKPLLPSAV